MSVLEKDQKSNLIVDAAQKRFGLFGIEKTSMREIADDLKLSKASLYYYFPDKESLYRAVIEKEQSEFLAKISEHTTRIHEPERLLCEFVNARLSYFRLLLNLSRVKLGAYSDLKPVFKETIRKFNEREKDIITKILEKGIDKGIFHVKDPKQTATLFLDLLKGLRISVVNDKSTLIIDEDEYEDLLKKTVAFTKIFIKGLKFK